MQIIREDSSLSRTQARQRAEGELGFAAHRESSKGPWNASPGALRRRGGILFGSFLALSFLMVLSWQDGTDLVLKTAIAIFFLLGALVGLVMLIVAVMWRHLRDKRTG